MTILGHPTAAELRAFYAAKDFENAKLATALEALPEPARSSAPGASWEADWKAYLARYAEAKKVADVAFALADASGVSPDLFPVQDAWVWALWAEHEPTLADRLFKRASTAPRALTDKQGLYDRLVALRGGSGLDFGGMPQPPARDADLAAFLAADKTVKRVEAAERFGVSYGPWLIGGVALVWLLSQLPRRR